MIREYIQPIEHRSPYPRISPLHPGRKNRITLEEWLQSGTGREPDPAIYSWNGVYLLLDTEGGRINDPPAHIRRHHRITRRQAD